MDTFFAALRPFKSYPDSKNVFYAMKINADDDVDLPDDTRWYVTTGGKVLSGPDSESDGGYYYVMDGHWLVLGKSGGFAGFTESLFRQVFGVEL